MGTTTFADWLREQFDAVQFVRAREVADAADITEGYLSALRSGRNERPSRKKAELIARFFAQRRGLSEGESQSLIAEACAVVAEAHEPRDRHIAANVIGRRQKSKLAAAPPVTFDAYREYLAAFHDHDR